VTAAVVSYKHSYALVRAHGETGLEAFLLVIEAGLAIWLECAGMRPVAALPVVSVRARVPGSPSKVGT
jgi:hypothetical protein